MTPGQGQSSRLLLLKEKARGHPLVPQAWPPFQSLCALGPLVHSPLTTGGKGLCVPGVAGMTLCKAGEPRSTWTATRTAQALPLQGLLNATRADPKTSEGGEAQGTRATHWHHQRPGLIFLLVQSPQAGLAAPSAHGGSPWGPPGLTHTEACL